MMKEIYIGVVSGVLSAVAVYAIGITIKKILIPWIETIVYKGVMLDGLWVQQINYQEDNEHDKYTLSIQQHAQKVNGTLSISYVRENEITNGTYIINGEVSDGYFQASLKSNTKYQSSRANNLLKISGNGRKMKGRLIYKTGIEDAIEVVELDLNKEASGSA